jgi:hypothetical protein
VIKVKVSCHKLLFSLSHNDDWEPDIEMEGRRRRRKGEGGLKRAEAASELNRHIRIGRHIIWVSGSNPSPWMYE